jgi:hypothetical protein
MSSRMEHQEKFQQFRTGDWKVCPMRSHAEYQDRLQVSLVVWLTAL